MSLAYNPNAQFRDNVGNPVAGGTLIFWENLTNTKVTIYSDAALSTEQNNPYTLDAAGRMTADVYFDDTVSIQLNDANGAQVRVYDDVSPAASSGALATIEADIAALESDVDDIETSLTQRGVNAKDAPYNATGDGSTDDSTSINAWLAESGELWLPEGTYNCDSVLAASLTKATNITGPGILKFTGAANTETFVNLSTETDFTMSGPKFDANNKAAKVFVLDNVTDAALKPNVLINGKCKFSNAQQTASTGLAAGLIVEGSFGHVDITGNGIYDTVSVGGTNVARGIWLKADDTKAYDINSSNVERNIIDTVTASADADGIVLQSDVTQVTRHRSNLIGNFFFDCAKRSIKSQIWGGTIVGNHCSRLNDVSITNSTEVSLQLGGFSLAGNDAYYGESGGISFAPTDGFLKIANDSGIVNGTTMNGLTINCENNASMNKVVSISGATESDNINIGNVTVNGTAEYFLSLRPTANAGSGTVNGENITFSNVIVDTIAGTNPAWIESDRSGSGFTLFKLQFHDCSVRSATVDFRYEASNNNNFDDLVCMNLFRVTTDETLGGTWLQTRDNFQVQTQGAIELYRQTATDTTTVVAIDSDVGGTESRVWRVRADGSMRVQDTAATDYAGAGSPEGVVSAAVGSIYRRTDGAAGTSFYVKESGTGDTGWIGK